MSLLTLKDRKQIWSIPNLLSFFRILLIPVMVTLYVKGRTIAALVVFGVAAGRVHHVRPRRPTFVRVVEESVPGGLDCQRSACGSRSCGRYVQYLRYHHRAGV